MSYTIVPMLVLFLNGCIPVSYMLPPLQYDFEGQQFGAASTYGKKYALGNLFLIDDTEDADATNTHGKADVKPRITVEQFNKAKEYITNGGNVNAIKTKYKLTSKQEEELTKL